MAQKILSLLHPLMRPLYRSKQWSWPMTIPAIHHPLHEQIVNVYSKLFSKCYTEKTLVKITPVPGVEFSMYCVGNQGSVEMSLLIGGMYEPVITEVFIQKIQGSSVFIDIGANIGYYTLLGAAILPEAAKILSFEPVNEAFERLQENISVNHFDRVQAYHCAIGKEDGEANVYLRKELGHNSLLESGASQNNGVVEKIGVKKLDGMLDYQNENVFLKIDIEGFEFEALQGMEKLLRNNPCKIVFEFTPGLFHLLNQQDPVKYAVEFLEFLQKLGYTIFYLHNEELKHMSDIHGFVAKNGTIQTYLFCEKQPSA